MMSWLSANLVNIALIAAVALLVYFCARSLIRDKKAGKTCGGNCASCGGACAGCSMAGTCHPQAAGKRKA